MRAMQTFVVAPDVKCSCTVSLFCPFFYSFVVPGLVLLSTSSRRTVGGVEE